MTSDAFDPFALIRVMLGSRAFALADAPPDPELLALLRLGEGAAAEGVAVALSAMTTPRVRSLFPNEAATTFRTKSGLRLTVDGGDIFGATIAAGYMPESRDFEAFMLLVGPGSVVVDVGANFGLYALSAAIYARPHGCVYAFEPAPGAFAMLEGNIAANALGALVRPKQAAVAASSGSAQFYVGRDVSFSSLHRTTRIDAGANEVNVEIVTLDAALAETPSIDVLKIDVEGGEAGVLRGARGLLQRSRAPIVQFEFSHKNMDDARGADFAETVAMLAQDGFRIYRRGATGPVGLPGRAEAFSGNLFLAREGDGAARLMRALERTQKTAIVARDAGALALLRRVAAQNEALQQAELLRREAILVADSVVGEGVSGASEAVRAVQQAWLDVRQRAREAEAQARGLEARTGRLVDERDQLLEKVSGLRHSIDHLHQALEQSRSNAVAIQERNTEKSTSLRQIEARLRERVDTLEGALKASQEKLVASRVEYEQLTRRVELVETKRRERVDALEALLKASQEKLAAGRADSEQLTRRLKSSENKREHLIKITKRLQTRCEALLVQLAELGEVERTQIDENSSS